MYSMGWLPVGAFSSSEPSRDDLNMWLFLPDYDCAEERSCLTHFRRPLCRGSRSGAVGDDICFQCTPSSFEQWGYLTTAIVCVAETDRLKSRLPL
jgi:hypothetical protein